MPNANAAKCRLQAALRGQVVRISTELSALLTINVVTSRLRKVVRQIGCAYPQKSIGEPVRTT